MFHFRYLKHKMRSLHGHVNWVKNIEYSRREQYLATSGFDGAVFLWDINRHSEDEVSNCKLIQFGMHNVVRDLIPRKECISFLHFRRIVTGARSSARRA